MECVGIYLVEGTFRQLQGHKDVPFLAFGMCRKIVDEEILLDIKVGSLCLEVSELMTLDGLCFARLQCEPGCAEQEQKQ